MTQPSKTPITVFEKIRQQIELPGPAAAPGVAEQLFTELKVGEFLETQAASMRAAGFRAAAEPIDATHMSLSWVPRRDAAPNAQEARIDIRVVEGSVRLFRARLIFQNFNGQRECVGLCAQTLDAAMLNRWFAHFTEVCLAGQVLADERIATGLDAAAA